MLVTKVKTRRYGTSTKMKTYNNLREKIIDKDNLKQAHYNARKDKTFYKEVQMVDSNLDYYIDEIHDMLKDGEYKIEPSDYIISTINDKGKERVLAKLNYYPHRIIQRAVMLILEPIFMEVFCNHTCASLKGRGIHYAYNLITKYLKDKEWTKYCLKIDIKKFYPSINHEILKQLLRKKISCKKTLKYLDDTIDSTGWEKWIPIGSYLSQYLANYTLAYFDHRMKEDMKCRYIVRYMDDIVVLSDSKEQLHNILKEMEKYLGRLKLEIKPNRQIFPTRKRWVDFVGYRFFGNFILLRKGTFKRMKDKIRQMLETKTNRKRLLNYSERCSLNSYVGWIIYCDHWRLYEKRIQPIIKSLNRYYYYVITRDEKKLKRYYEELIKKKTFIFCN